MLNLQRLEIFIAVVSAAGNRRTAVMPFAARSPFPTAGHFRTLSQHPPCAGKSAAFY